MATPMLKFSHMGAFAKDVEKLGLFFETVLGFTRTDKGTVRLLAPQPPSPRASRAVAAAAIATAGISMLPFTAAAAEVVRTGLRCLGRMGRRWSSCF